MLALALAGVGAAGVALGAAAAAGGSGGGRGKDQCAAQLQQLCGSAHGDPFACAECAGTHAAGLRAAGCSNDAIAAWCAGVPAPTGLGPGPREWQVDRPENHGLDSAKLKAAAELTAKVAPERYCLLVVKDGVLIHESYFGGNTSDSLYETDSLGKTVTAAMFGSVVQDGLLDIDRPVVDYGVQPTTNFEPGHSWGSFFPHVTTKSLLAQASGYGVVEPGTEFTYDSDEYIQHLSYTLSKVVKNGTALSYAQRWAKQMGMEGYFDYDQVGEDQGGPTQFAAAGGQMVTCREIARVGQLINNKGKWVDAAGRPFQLADPVSRIEPSSARPEQKSRLAEPTSLLSRLPIATHVQAAGRLTTLLAGLRCHRRLPLLCRRTWIGWSRLRTPGRLTATVF